MSRNQQSLPSAKSSAVVARHPLYTPEQRVRRDESVWTLIQGVLAPIQFFVFLTSLVLVLRYLWTGSGLDAANISVVVKTITLYTIMITGCIWEKVVFDCYLFAPAFFWEDVFSMLVLALHTAYLYSLATGALSPQQLMYLALAAYATYIINAGQFLWKLRVARLDYAAQLKKAQIAEVTGTTDIGVGGVAA
jgi:3-vinyl bacteriochlorophyllide hydratase